LKARAGAADDQCDEIQREEALCADGLFERRAEEKQRDRIEEQVSEVTVHEAAGDQRAVFAVFRNAVRPQQVAIDDTGRGREAERAHRDDEHQDGVRCDRKIELHHGAPRV
jgi:hypothetical protein